MGMRKVTFAQNEYYHVYNRGTDKREIFLDDSDRCRFTELLYLCNSNQSVSVRNLHREYDSVYDFEKGEPVVAIGAYCLMPNHFHVLMTPLSESGVVQFMNKLGTAYSMYFNKKYDRSGSLFQGRFKAKHVDSDEYLKYLFAYIHLNPVKLVHADWKEKGIRDIYEAYRYLQKYKFSSFGDFCGQLRGESKILNVQKFPNYFIDALHHHKEIIEWLNFNDVIRG